MIASNQTNREEQFDRHDKLQRMLEGAEKEGWVYLPYVGVPQEEVGDAKDVVDHGVPVAAGVEDGRAIRAAEFHRCIFSSVALLSPHHRVQVVALSCVGTKRNRRSTVEVTVVGAAAGEACLGFTTGPASPLPFSTDRIRTFFSGALTMCGEQGGC